MNTGTQDGYKWLETDHRLSEFIPVCQNTIIGKYLVITAVDSGVFQPSREDELRGWRAIGGVAYSPLVESVAELPSDCCCRDCCGFDEWYLFDRRPGQLGSICHQNVFEASIAEGNVFQFANFYGFRFTNPVMQPVVDLFWNQVRWAQPESYVADCDGCLVFATRNSALFENVVAQLSNSPSTLSGDTEQLHE